MHIEKAPEWLAHHDYVLNQSMVASFAVNNTVMVSWTNMATLDFALNWVHHCRKAGIHKCAPRI